MLRAGYALAQAPGSRLLRRSAHTEDRPAVFAAQVALSHARWPGLLFPRRLTRIGRGLPAAALVLATVAAGGTMAARLPLPSCAPPCSRTPPRRRQTITLPPTPPTTHTR